MSQVPSTGIGSPNDLGLVPNSAGPQQPSKPTTSLSPAPPPSNPGGGGGVVTGTGNGDFPQSSYNGTELVMLYDYKVQAIKSKNLILFLEYFLP